MNQLIYFLGSMVLVVVVGMIFIWGASVLNTFISEKILFTTLNVIEGIILISVIIVFIYYLLLAIFK